MTQSMVPPIEQSGLREVISFPKIDEFYDLLQDRLHMVAGSYILEHEFTLIINALPRRTTQFLNRFENVPLIYAGIPRQRELLEGEPIRWRRELDEYWDLLDSSNLISDTAVVSSQLYQSFNLGTYGLADIPRVGSGRLEDYFASILYPNRAQKGPTPRQEAEYHILKNYFNLLEDHYLSIPLVQFGEFDGIVHVVYTDADKQNISPRSIGNLIRSFSSIMETLVLEWDLVGRNPEKTKAIMVPLNPIFYEKVNRNPILRELKFDVYYQKHLPFFKSRIRFNDEVIHSKVYRPYLKTAIISIMIDSYAHNVSAHSLVALNWWFKRRADALRDHRDIHRQEVDETTEIIKEYVPEGFEQDRLFDLIKPWVRGAFVGDVDEEYDVVKYPGSLAREIQPLIKFLMQKGAFWSGIARDNHFGGESSPLFEVLWNDFINNPLYLGTIAKSEDIHRISLHIVHYDSVSEKMTENNLTEKKVLLEGELVRIDLKEQRTPEGREEGKGYYLDNAEGERLYYEQHPELATMSEFVAPGSEFVAIKELLQNIRVFLPGEVVGRHAFFTLLENEIRNVKHYKGESLHRIQREGLKLYISIQENEVVANSGQFPIYKVGIWIGASADLVLPDGGILVERKYAGLHKDVMDEETFAPRLGGGFQDKICSGMLFNNRFGNVQNGDGNVSRDLSEDTIRDEIFYPWIIPATSSLEHPHVDVEVTGEVAADWWNFRDHYPHQKGYFKKYFHLWKAADIKEVIGESDADFVWENLARFKFVNVRAEENMALYLKHKIRAAGVLRILKSPLPSTTGSSAILAAYQDWLQTWLGPDSYCLQLRVDGALTGQFSYDPNREEVFVYQHTEELKSAQQEDLDQYDHIKQIDIAHGGMSLDPSLLRYRNHGIYKKYFLSAFVPGQALSTKAKARMAELFEVFTTRISIFDNRIYSRIRGDERLSVYQDTLELSIYPEESSVPAGLGEWSGRWEAEKQERLPNCHFLILHLSYIEKILLAKYSDHPDYEEENVGLFIEQEILPLISQGGGLRENFILVITTGRGRTKWWSKLSDNAQYQTFTRFTMFRPVESLISVIEDAIARKDDLELKYNLVKILFGA